MIQIKNLTVRHLKQTLSRQYILNYVKLAPDSDGQEFIKLCKHFDHIRNQNFANTHPEVAKAMGYVYNKTL